MDEQQMNEGLLCDADRQLIASAARLQKYVEAPVPAGLLGELSDDLRFHSVCVEVETLEPVWAGSRLHEPCQRRLARGFFSGCIAHAQRENDQLSNAYRNGEWRGR